jgi:peptide/nickel transport system substrate-binding protein
VVLKIFLISFFLAGLSFVHNVRICTAKMNHQAFTAFVSSGHPKSLNPFDNSDGITSNQLNQIFETLTSYDEEGRLIPLLATSWRWIDPQTLELKLRTGVVFHNGEPFDSRAVEFTVKQFINSGIKIANRQYADSISGIDVIDKTTVRIKTSRPDGFLVEELATVCHILPPHYFKEVGAAAFARSPMGTGPFRFVESDFKNKMKLQTFERYWGDRPVIDTLEFNYFTDYATALTKMRTGELDFISHLPGIMVHQLLDLDHISISKHLNQQSIMVLVNTAKKNSPLNSLPFRRDLLARLDFEEVIKYYAFGNGTATSSLSLPGEPYYEPELGRENRGRGNSPFPAPMNSLKAPSYIFRIQATEPLGVMGKIIAKQMSDAGLKVNLQIGTAMDEFREVVGFKNEGRIPEIDFLVSHCAHLYPAFPHLVLLPSTGNWSLTSDLNLDKMLRNVTTTLDVEQQKSQFLAINQYVYDQALIYPAFQASDIYAYDRKYVFSPHATSYIFFKYLKLSKSGQKELARTQPKRFLPRFVAQGAL